jgi:hypothetical protein
MAPTPIHRLKIGQIALSSGERGIFMTTKPSKATPTSDHEETYDKWFLRRVDRAVAQANDPDTQWVPHDVVMRDWEEQREEILAMIKTKK